MTTLALSPSPVATTSPFRAPPAQAFPHSRAPIIDIRRSTDDFDVKQDILSSLQPGEGKEKKMPTILLYDTEGLKLFEEITYLDEYYLTNAEIEVLQTWAVDMARQIKPGSMVVELGSGNLRKTGILLAALDSLNQPFSYYALDLSLPELERTLAAVPSYRNVSTHGLHGTYDDGLAWLQLPQNRPHSKCIMSLGSSIGNFDRDSAAQFLSGFSAMLDPRTDSLLIGLDGCKDGERVWRAYNDTPGTTRRFIMNGLKHANEVLGEQAFRGEDWEYVGEFDSDHNRHQAFYWANKDLVYKDIHIARGEKVRVEESHKYSAQQRAELWAGAGVTEFVTWGARGAENDYYVHMVVPKGGGA